MIPISTLKYRSKIPHVAWFSSESDHGNLKKRKEPKNLTSKLPMSLKSLLQRSPKGLNFPKLSRISRLSREFSLAGLDVDRIEVLLRRKLLPASLRNYSKSDDEFHATKALLEKFMTSPVNSLDRLQSIESLFKCLNDLEDTARQEQEKNSHVNLQNRIDYFVSLVRLSHALEDSVKHLNQEELNLIERFCKNLLSSYSNPSPIFILWMALFQRASDVTLRTAKRLFVEFPEITTSLIDELDEYSRDYTKQIESTLPHLLYQNLPQNFCIGDISRFCDRLESSNVTSSDPSVIFRSLCYKSRALWNATKFSKSLSNLAVALEFWLAHVEQSPSSSFVSLGYDVITCLSEIVSVSVVNDFEPSLKFLDVVAQKLDGLCLVPMVPYVLHIHYKTNEKYSFKAEEIFQTYPSIEVCKNEKFERALTLPSMTTETKKYFISEMVKSIPAIDKELRSLETARSSQFENSIVFSPKVLQDMLDVKILELLKEEKCSECMEVVQRESSKGVLPSNEVLTLIAQNLSRQKDVHQLATLRSIVPAKTETLDRIYSYEISLKLADIHKKWDLGEEEVALSLTLEEYRRTLEDEYLIQKDSLDFMLSKIRRYLRLYLEECLSRGDSNQLRLVKETAVEFTNVHDDFSLLALFWEVYFFSPTFKDQSRAVEIIQEFPKLPQHLDFDLLVSRADRYSVEGFYRKLLEISLQFDLETHKKKRSLEGLLLHQCMCRNFTAAKATIDYAHEIHVSVGQETMKAYLQLKTDLSSKTKKGFFDFNFFSSKK